MVIVNIVGGLGNQMFQYAYGRALSSRMGYDIKFDLRDFGWYTRHEGMQLSHLGVPYEEALPSDLSEFLGWRNYTWGRRLRLHKHLPSSRTVVERSQDFSDAYAKVRDNSYLVGYWQSHKYFEEYSKEIRALYLRPIELPEYSTLLREIDDSESVAVHVRRGDYVSAKWRTSLHGLMDASYYARAILLLQKRVREPRFFVFSDEPSILAQEQLIGVPYTLVNLRPRPTAYMELRAMSRCKHFIIANSSFSWWAAWLGGYPGKEVIAPLRWFSDPSRKAHDLIPPEWTRV